MFLLPAHTLPLQLSPLAILVNPESRFLSPLFNSLAPSLPPEAQKTPYYASYSPTRLAVHTLCTSHYLDLTITFIICINVITMSLEHYSQPKVPPLWAGATPRGRVGLPLAAALGIKDSFDVKDLVGQCVCRDTTSTMGYNGFVVAFSCF